MRKSGDPQQRSRPARSAFAFEDAESIFRSFFGGADPFESMLGGRGGLGRGGGMAAASAFGDGFGGGDGFCSSSISSDFGGAAGTVHVTRTVRNADGTVHTTQYTQTTTTAGGGGGGRGGSGGGRQTVTHRSSTSSGGGAVGGGSAAAAARPPQPTLPSRSSVPRARNAAAAEAEAADILSNDLAEAMRLSRDEVDDEEERMLQAAIQASMM